jgi:hypothetical protein
MQSKEHGWKPPPTYPARASFSTLLLRGTIETSASFKARSAPSSYPTTNESALTAGPFCSAGAFAIGDRNRPKRDSFGLVVFRGAFIAGFYCVDFLLIALAISAGASL